MAAELRRLCWRCGARYSVDATQCTNCGEPNNTWQQLWVQPKLYISVGGGTIILPTLLLSLRPTWARRVQGEGWSGKLLVKLCAPDAIAVQCTYSEPLNHRTLVSHAGGKISTALSDILANATEGIDRFPDAFWEALRAPLPPDQE